MPVRTIKTKSPISGGSAQALVEEARKRAGRTGDGRGGVLVVFGDDAAHVYYEGDDPAPAGPGKRRRLRRPSAA